MNWIKKDDYAIKHCESNTFMISVGDFVTLSHKHVGMYTTLYPFWYYEVSEIVKTDKNFILSLYNGNVNEKVPSDYVDKFLKRNVYELVDFTNRHIDRYGQKN